MGTTVGEEKCLSQLRGVGSESFWQVRSDLWETATLRNFSITTKLAWWKYHKEGIKFMKRCQSDEQSHVKMSVKRSNGFNVFYSIQAKL